MENKMIIVLRTRQCRRSDLIIKFLQAENIPNVVKSLETDPEAQRLAQQFDLCSSPGIIVNGRVVHPYQMIENCQIKYAADSLFAEELPSVNIAGQNDPVPPSPDASGELTFINAGQLRQLVSERQAMLLDARTPAESEAGHLPGAMLLPFDLLHDYEEQINALPKDKWLICYCDGPPCDLGELLAKELLLRDFQKVAVYQDGVNDWKKSYPVIKGKEAGEFEK